MNIFFMNGAGLAVWGGCEKWMLRLGLELRERSHSIFYGGRKDSLFLKTCEKEHFPTLNLKINSDLNPFLIRELATFFREHHIDLIVNERNKDIRITGIASKFNGNKVLVARTGLPSIKNNFRYQLIFPKIIDGIIVTTQSIKQKYLSYSWLEDESIRVIHEGVLPIAPPVFDSCQLKKQFNLPEGKKILGIFGKLSAKKQHRVFLEVAANLLKTHSDIVFLIVGDGPEHEKLQQFAQKLGILEQIYMIGFQEDLFPLYRICDLVLLTSQEEGIPRTIMESMLMEKPVVAFDVGGVSELIQEDKNGVLIPPNDIYIMTKKVEHLLEDQPRIEQMGKVARKYILENCSLKKMVDNTENYFHELLSKKRGNHHEA